MFLSDKEILQRLQKSELLIEPEPDDIQLGPFTVDCRLGTQFRHLPSANVIRNDAFDPIEAKSIDRLLISTPTVTVELGERIVIQSHSTLLGVTLELIQTPLDLATFIFPRSSWERLGLTIVPSIVYPGFKGKLTLSLHNLGNIPIALYPGIRIIGLAFAEIRSFVENRYVHKYSPISEPQFSKLYLDSDIERIKEIKSEKQKGLHSKRASPIDLKTITTAFQESGFQKGKALESLAAEIFKSIKGLKILKVDARLHAEELDLLLKNDITVGFWRFAGSPIVVECKNWSQKVGAREVSVLFDKLVSLGPKVCTGILIAPHGVTGDSHSDAVLKVREKRQQGRDIIILDKADLEEIAQGVHPVEVIDKKWEQLYQI